MRTTLCDGSVSEASNNIEIVLTSIEYIQFSLLLSRFFPICCRRVRCVSLDKENSLVTYSYLWLLLKMSEK